MNLAETAIKKYNLALKILRYPFIVHPRSYYDSDDYNIQLDDTENISVARYKNSKEFLITEFSHSGYYEWKGIIPEIIYWILSNRDKNDIWRKIINETPLTKSDQKKFCCKLKKSGLIVKIEQQNCDIDSKKGIIDFKDVSFIQCSNCCIEATKITTKPNEKISHKAIIKVDGKKLFEDVGNFAEDIFLTFNKMPRQLSLSR